jgi:putative Ca2+/H+ antiporter (TMEM165/GDT1 family)
MRDMLGFVFVLICGSAGAVLLYDAVEDTISTQTLAILVGAALLALAMVAVGGILKSRLEWRQRSPKPGSSER